MSKDDREIAKLAREFSAAGVAPEEVQEALKEMALDLELEHPQVATAFDRLLAEMRKEVEVDALIRGLH